MTRVLHRWTPPDVRSLNLSIRTCVKCSLEMHSRHEGIEHWKEYYTADAPDVKLTRRPECVREKEAVG